jgi:predicted PurR-regulated permease PerM
VVEERAIARVRPAAVMQTVGVVLAVAAAILVVWSTRRVLVWIAVALFLALALDPLVTALQRRGVRRRGGAVAVVYLAGLLVVAGLAALFVPLVVRQATSLVDDAPRFTEQLTSGQGPLGFLQSRFGVVDKVRGAVENNGAGTALSVTRGVVTGVAGVVTIAFLTLFMLLEGPRWRDRAAALLPDRSRERWTRVGGEIARTIGGYVSGNLLLSVMAGTATTLVLLGAGVPDAVALGVVVALLDLIPLAGATVAAVLVTLVALTASVTSAVVVGVFFLLYQQLENHVLQPLVYGRTVELSPLTVLISVLVGAELAGIVGALAAIPVAGTIRVLLRDWSERGATGAQPAPPAGADPPRFSHAAGAGRPDITVSGRPRRSSG